MKKKLLRRFLCVLLTLVIILTVSISASAVSWQNLLNGGPFIIWTTYGTPTPHSIVNANIASASTYWTTAVNKPATIIYTSDYSLALTSGVLLHTSPDVEWWRSYFPTFSASYMTVLAIARIVSTDGTFIEKLEEPNGDLAQGIVDYAYIEYNPREETVNAFNPGGNLSEDEQATYARSMVAHEIGHCMGVPHVTTGNIMKAENPYGTELSSSEEAKYNSIYP